MEKETTNGDQINRKVDIQLVGKQFLNFYYDNWINNPNQLFNSGVIRNHTRLKFNDVIYTQDLLANFIYTTKEKGISFKINSIQIMDSGARRCDILVSGKVRESKDSQETFNFSQYFTIANNKENWFLHNSLLNIFQ